MKKNLTTIFLLLLFTVSYSQNKFGAFAGLNYNYLTQGNYEAFLSESSVSLHVGVLYEMPLNESISFRPKLMYSTQGDRKKTDQSEFNLTAVDYKLSYINVPMDFKFWNKIYLIAGPQIGYLVNTEKMSDDYGDVESKIDFGINVGAGYSINKIFIELSAYKGFSKIVEYEDQFNKQNSLTNTLVRLSVGYYF